MSLIEVETLTPQSTTPEPFVDAQRAAEFLSIEPRQLLRLARAASCPVIGSVWAQAHAMFGDSDFLSLQPQWSSG